MKQDELNEIKEVLNKIHKTLLYVFWIIGFCDLKSSLPFNLLNSFAKDLEKSGVVIGPSRTYLDCVINYYLILSK